MNWNVVIAVCTAVAAAFTAVMAFYTRSAIKNAQQQFRGTQTKSEKHHRDAFRPVVVLSQFEGVEPEDRSSVIQFDPSARAGHDGFVRIAGTLRNVGVGPALDVRLYFWAMGNPNYGFSLALAPIGAHEQCDLARSGLRYAVRPTDAFNSADMASASGTGWALVIEYGDAFGNRFHTIHHKDPQLPWAVCGMGPAPSGAELSVSH